MPLAPATPTNVRWGRKEAWANHQVERRKSGPGAGRTEWAAAPRGGIPNDLGGNSIRPARVLAATGATQKDLGPAGRPHSPWQATAWSAEISARMRNSWRGFPT